MTCTSSSPSRSTTRRSDIVVERPEIQSCLVDRRGGVSLDASRLELAVFEVQYEDGARQPGVLGSRQHCAHALPTMGGDEHLDAALLREPAKRVAVSLQRAWVLVHLRLLD